MNKLYAMLIFLVSTLYALTGIADIEACREVRFADVGWTDISATSAVAANLLESKGYNPKITVLSVAVTYASLKNNDIDVFMGNWMPSSASDIEPYLKEKSLVQLSKNLEHARYTLAVPSYVYDAGVRDFADLAPNARKFDNKIFGIEPGNDGNNRILNMIKENAFGLGKFNIVESNEQGMLIEVKRASLQKKWIVFLGWSPHPMNKNIDMKYLSGGDKFFGPNFGDATVYTVVRRDFENDCPQLAEFFRNFKFTVDMENRLMELILNDGKNPAQSAEIFLSEHSELKEQWLSYLPTLAKKAERKKLAIEKDIDKIAQAAPKLPLGEGIEHAVDFVTERYAQQLSSVSSTLELAFKKTTDGLKAVPDLLLVVICALLVLVIHRSLGLTVLVALGLLLIFNLGYFDETIETVVLVMFSTILSVIIGVPLGIIAARHRFIYGAMQPVLDLMQTIPTFVYLIPTLMLFGLGMVPGLISTVIFAMPAPIRLTYLGIMSVPKELVEAGEAFGCTKMQQLIKIKLPYALPSIRAGITQCIMLSLSMVVIAALVGAEGLGTPVVRALNTVNIKQGIEAGIAIVVLAIILDRTLRVTKQSYEEASEGRRS